MNAIEKAIRENFPGKSNAGLRAYLRDAAKSGSVMGASRRFALTGHIGIPSLKAVQAVVSAESPNAAMCHSSIADDFAN